MRLLESLHQAFDIDPGRHREAAQVVFHAGLAGSDEISQRIVVLTRRLRCLLAERVECGQDTRTRLVSIDLDIIPHARRGEEAYDGSRGQQPLLDDLFEELLRVAEQLLGPGAHLRLLEYFRV